MFDVAKIPGPGPMSEINTTPLIDVMLVLLIMFLIAIPVATHKVPIELPPPGAGGPPPPGHDLAMLPNGALRWDGAAIGGAALEARLAALAADPERPVLRIRVDGAARYADADRLLAAVARARVERIGFVGHGGFAQGL